jgi:hypothetical protein
MGFVNRAVRDGAPLLFFMDAKSGQTHWRGCVNFDGEFLVVSG